MKPTRTPLKTLLFLLLVSAGLMPAMAPAQETADAQAQTATNGDEQAAQADEAKKKKKQAEEEEEPDCE